MQALQTPPEAARSRLQGDEKLAIQFLLAGCKAVEKAVQPLTRRCKSHSRLYTKIRAAQGGLNKSLEELLDTIPLEQLQTLKRNLTGMELRLQFKNIGKVEHMEYVDLDALKAVCDTAIQNTCPYCDGTPDKRVKCPLLKALRTLPYSQDEDLEDCAFRYRMEEY